MSMPCAALRSGASRIARSGGRASPARAPGALGAEAFAHDAAHVEEPVREAELEQHGRGGVGAELLARAPRAARRGRPGR